MPRSLLVAALTLSAVAGAGWMLQAATLARPTRAQLELVKTLRALGDYHGSQASVELGGRRYRASCNQQWDPAARAVRVVVDPGVVTETGSHLAATGPLQEGEFELAGCPRALVDWLSAELVRGASIRFRPTPGERGLDQLELHPRTLPLDLFVEPASGLPVRISFSASHLEGTSVVRYSAERYGAAR